MMTLRTFAWDLMPPGLRIRLRGRAELRFFEAGLGDTLMTAAVAREVKRKYGASVQVSVHGVKRELCAENPYIDSCDERFFGMNLNYHEGRVNAGPHLTRNLIATMCRKVGIQHPSSLLPELRLSNNERAEGIAFVQGLPRPLVTLHTTAGPYDAGRKAWPATHWAMLAAALSGAGIASIQLGAADDISCNAQTDARGRFSFRQSAAILSAADLHVGIVSSLMHAAAALEKPAVILYGGFERYSAHGYPLVMPIESAISCSPCTAAGEKQVPCPIAVRCMQDITPATVFSRIREALHL